MRIAPLVVLLAAASSPALADPETQLIGRITEVRSHHPIEGATVSIGTFQTTTDKNGLYRIVLREGGDFSVTFDYADQHTTRPVKIVTGAVVTADGTLDVDSNETIVIHDHILPRLAAKPVKHYLRIAPRYSDEAIEHDVWARAWVLVDIDERGDVTRVKLLQHPGYGLDQIAIEKTLAMKFAPAQDSAGNPTSSRQVWPIEWPSYWWLVAREGVTTGIPPYMYHVPCKGSGPMNLGSVHPGYRDCSMPDLSKAASEPWIYRKK